MIDDLSDYEPCGDPLVEHRLTRAHERRQEDAERTTEYVREIVAKAPPLSDEQVVKLRAIFAGVREQPPSELMRWRLRLYCGHVVERTAHRTRQTVHAAFTGSLRCPTCGLDPATIIAAAPLGLLSESARAQPDLTKMEAELRRVNRKANAAEREHQRIATHAVKLRQQLDAARPDSGRGDGSR